MRIARRLAPIGLAAALATAGCANVVGLSALEEVPCRNGLCPSDSAGVPFDSPATDSLVDSADTPGNVADGTRDSGVRPDGAEPVLPDSALPPDAPSPPDTSEADAPPSTTRTVFTSSMVYDGNLGGLAGADAKCQALAASAGLPGTFKAWLSDSKNSAAARLTHATVPYVLPDGTRVARDWVGMVSGSLDHAIDMTERKTAAPLSTVPCGGGPVPATWTNTRPSGSTASSSANCNDYTSSTATEATWGYPRSKDVWWTDWCTGSGSPDVCNERASIYCMQQ